MTGSVLFWVQHLLGIGHLRRAVHLVDAMARTGMEVCLVSGGEWVSELGRLADRRFLQLPPLRAADTSFGSLVDSYGRPAGEALWSARRDALLAVFDEVNPDAIVIEAYPFGRRAFHRELVPLIAAAQARRPRSLVFCSLRDIIVPPRDPKRAFEIVEKVRADFDAVFVHGDRRLIALDESFPLASQVEDRLVYTGYVAGPLAGCASNGPGADQVVVSAGGGVVGGALLRAALAARRAGCFAETGWRLLTGPNLPAAEFAGLATGSPAGVIVERYRGDFPQLLRRCRVSISQAGYNTVLDVIAARARAVLVPFADGRESEQTLRAERLAAHGVAEVVPAAALTARRLCDAIERAVGRGAPTLDLDLSGACRTARTIAEMISA